MRRKITLLLTIMCGLMLVVGMSLLLQSSAAEAQAPLEPTQIIKNGLSYLQTQQQADGGILGFSGVSDPDTTSRSLMAVVAAGEPVSGVVSTQGRSMLDYLSTQAISFTHDTTSTLFPGRAGLLLAAATLAGANPSDFGGMEVVKELETSLQPDTGAYSTTAKQDFSSGAASDLYQAWAILGLSLAGQQVPDEATQYLIQSQAGDGSWAGGDPDTTALAVTALLASGNIDVSSKTIQNALMYFHETQLANGGWRPSWDTDPLNADSTGWIVEALVSAGEDPTSQSWTKDGANPLQSLMSLQKADGSIGGTYANAYSTAEAIIGLSSKPLSSLGKLPAIHRAGLAVFSGAGNLFTDCVTFTQESISGLELLQRSGLAIETATSPNQGTAVCKIGDVGSSSDNCFGGMPNYWSYWQFGLNGWDYAVTGADQSKVVDGDVNAWSWGSGNPPALITFQNICEGVAFVVPTAIQTNQPATSTPPLTQSITAVPSAIPSAVAPLTSGSPTSPWLYIIYAAIIIVLGGSIYFVIRARSR